MSNLVDLVDHSIRIEIPSSTEAIARGIAPTVKNADQDEILAALLVYPILSRRGRACRLQLASRAGDTDILSVSYQKSPVGAHVHISTEKRRKGLCLPVAASKLHADIHLFLLAHVNGDSHSHLLGWLSRSDDTWSQYRNDPLPASGFRIPAARLRSFESLVDILDES